MFRTFLNGRGNDVELCGMFLGTPRVEHRRPPRLGLTIVELPNRSPDPEDRFEVHGADVAAALLEHGRTRDHVVGFWHTHPHPSDPHPSDDDWASVLLGARHWWHCVYHPETDTVTWYDYDENIYVERPSTRPRTRRKKLRKEVAS